MKGRFIALTLAVAMTCACTSNQYLIEPEAPVDHSAVKDTVYVLNPEQAEQFSVLQQSGIYVISTDATTDKKLKLTGMYGEKLCGMPFLGAVVFLGLLPVSVEKDYRFTYEIQQGERRQAYLHNIPVKLRMSVWEWLATPFASTEDELLIEGLPLYERQPTTDSPGF
jgi:hypothetical protein